MLLLMLMGAVAMPLLMLPLIDAADADSVAAASSSSGSSNCRHTLRLQLLLLLCLLCADGAAQVHEGRELDGERLGEAGEHPLGRLAARGLERGAQPREAAIFAGPVRRRGVRGLGHRRGRQSNRTARRPGRRDRGPAIAGPDREIRGEIFAPGAPSASVRAMSGPPRALLLDLDGTLIDSEMVHVAGLVRLCRDRGVELAEAESLYVIGHGWREIHAHLRLGERLGLDLAAVIAGTVAAKEVLFGEGLELPVLPGARELLALARAAGIPTAIVTGSARCEFDQALPALGLRPGDLAASVCAEDVPHGKPSPIGYLRAAQLLAAPPGACLVVEDSEAGIAAGVAAGMRVVAVAAGNRPPGAPGHQDQGGAHHRLASLAGLRLDDLAALMAERA